jgi:hypothetical protein
MVVINNTIIEMLFKTEIGHGTFLFLDAVKIFLWKRSC